MRTLNIIVAAILMMGTVQAADIVIDLGNVGIVTVATAVVPIAKTVLDRFMPPEEDEDGNPIPWTGAEYKANLHRWIIQRGWISFVRECQKQYQTENPYTYPQVSDHMTLTES